MKRVLLTGMSGTGKSTVVGALAARGYRAADTDDGGLSEVGRVPDGEPTGPGPGQDRVWREDRIHDLLAAAAAVLFLGGCAPNQGTFHPRFDHVVLPTAPAHVIVARLATRPANPYGKRPEEVAPVLGLLRTVEPLPRRGAGHAVDTGAPPDRVVAAVLRLVGERARATLRQARRTGRSRRRSRPARDTARARTGGHRPSLGGPRSPPRAGAWRGNGRSLTEPVSTT